MSNSTPARASLLGLPAELGNEICHLAMPEGVQHLDFNMRRRSSEDSRRSSIPGILQTCRGLRTEVFPVYYGTCKFSIAIHNHCLDTQDDVDSVEPIVWSWLSGLDQAARKALLENALYTKVTYASDSVLFGAWLRAKYGFSLRDIWRSGQPNGASWTR